MSIGWAKSSFGPHYRIIAEEERTYGRLIELRDLFHAIFDELDRAA